MRAALLGIVGRVADRIAPRMVADAVCTTTGWQYCSQCHHCSSGLCRERRYRICCTDSGGSYCYWTGCTHITPC